MECHPYNRQVSIYFIEAQSNTMKDTVLFSFDYIPNEFELKQYADMDKSHTK